MALEMADDTRPLSRDETGGYGRETDWWSMGAMLYELAYGVAPFFARDIKQTYLKITDHHVRAPGGIPIFFPISNDQARFLLLEKPPFR